MSRTPLERSALNFSLSKSRRSCAWAIQSMTSSKLYDVRSQIKTAFSHAKRCALSISNSMSRAALRSTSPWINDRVIFSGICSFVGHLCMGMRCFRKSAARSISSLIHSVPSDYEAENRQPDGPVIAVVKQVMEKSDPFGHVSHDACHQPGGKNAA